MVEVHSDSSSGVLLGILLAAVVAIVLFLGYNYMRGAGNGGAPADTTKVSGELNIPNSLVPNLSTGSSQSTPAQ